MKVKMDIVQYYNRQNIKLLNDELYIAKPKAIFSLDKTTQFLIYKRLKSLRFIDGYVFIFTK